MMDAGTQSFPLKLSDGSYNVQSFKNMTEEETFYYVFALLQSAEFQQKYRNDLQKDLPNIPMVKERERYIEIGRKLVELATRYDSQQSWTGVTVSDSSNGQNMTVKKMKHPKMRNAQGKLVPDNTKIIFNDNVTISGIPERAYKYVVNGRPAIEWIIDQYQVKTDNKSGITDDPNDFSDDPKYILNLLLSVITVSMKTLELIDQLPKFSVIK
jgi:predicted helicase